MKMIVDTLLHKFVNKLIFNDVYFLVMGFTPIVMGFFLSKYKIS